MSYIHSRCSTAYSELTWIPIRIKEQQQEDLLCPREWSNSHGWRRTIQHTSDGHRAADWGWADTTLWHWVWCRLKLTAHSRPAQTWTRWSQEETRQAYRELRITIREINQSPCLTVGGSRRDHFHLGKKTHLCHSYKSDLTPLYPCVQFVELYTHR